MKIDTKEVFWKALDKYQIEDGVYDLAKASIKEIDNAFSLLEDNDEIKIMREELNDVIDFSKKKYDTLIAEAIENKLD